MLKAVFFDWFNTLARYDPPREEVQRQALQEIGVEVSLPKVSRAISIADRAFFEENAISPIRKRSPEERAKVFTHYQKTVLIESGIDIDQELDIVGRTLKRVEELSQGMSFVLFSDALPTLEMLKKRSLVLGLLSNINKDMNAISRELGLAPYLDFMVTSGEAGVDKPEPLIFLTALQRAGVKASEAIHVGDQYKTDVIGARQVGISPILIDRNNLYPEVSDCPRIHHLTELAQHLT